MTQALSKQDGIPVLTYGPDRRKPPRDSYRYDWAKMDEVGWIFVPELPGYSRQRSAISSSARGRGIRVSIRSATLAGVAGYYVQAVR